MKDSEKRGFKFNNNQSFLFPGNPKNFSLCVGVWGVFLEGCFQIHEDLGIFVSDAYRKRREGRE